MGKAKDKERRLARYYYVDRRMEAQEVAEQVDVSYNTILKWRDEGKWDDIRTAKETGPEQLEADLKDLLQKLVQQKLALEKEDDSDTAEKERLIDEISKVNKTLENIRKTQEPSLRVYIHCIESFLNDLVQHDADLHKKLLDFSEDHIRRKAELLQ